MNLIVRHLPGVVGRALFVLVAATLALPSAGDVLHAQTVVGTVTETGTAQPVSGMFLVLQNEAGERRGGALSAADGSFHLQVPEAGTYRLVGEMIGYRTVTSPTFTVAAGGTVRQDLNVSLQPVALGGLTVEAEDRCRANPGSGAQTARLWDEARKALEISRWAEEQQALRFRIREIRRELDGASLQVLAEESRRRSGWYDGSPYRSIPGERLASDGYVQASASGDYDYYAPDAGILLSDRFLDRHCFHVAEPDVDEAHLIGLGFTPVRGGDHTDISGVLWLDETSGELQRVDFTYENLPFQPGRWDQIGGRVEFERLATGMWVVRKWYVRMPLEAQVQEHGRPTLVRLSEFGAEVQDVRTAEGTLLAQTAGATLYGTVERGTGDPLEGVEVAVETTEQRTVTGPDGAFRFSGLAAGTYAVTFRSEAHDLLGLEPEERLVELSGGRATGLPVEIRMDAGAAHAFCEEAGWVAPDGAEAVALYGRVLAPQDSTAVPGALVRLDYDGGRRTFTTDGSGAFRMCIPASPEPVRVAGVSSGGAGFAAAGEALAVQRSEPGFVRADVHLSARSTVASSVASSTGSSGSGWSNALVGRVVDGETSAPIADATIELWSRRGEGAVVGSALTDQAGRFRIPHPGEGSAYELRVQHLAYATASERMRFAPAEEVRLEVALAPEAIEMEGITVTERRRGLLNDVGFYRRMERGGGIFVDREEIERRQPARVTHLLQGKQQIRVVRSGMGEDIRILGAGQRVSSDPDVGFTDCQPAIWIDGMLARTGGEPRTRSTRPGTTIRSQALLSDLVTPEEIEAIEVFTSPAMTPPQYGGTGSICGVVLIWTRRD